jgi:hypothetical protein
MLIKLSGGVKADIDQLKITVGSRFLRYYFSDAYDKGEVTEIDDKYVVVDFVDTVRRFEIVKVTLVFGGGNDEHLMTHSEGELIKDFRGNNEISPCIDTLEDLLDFDKWMV